MVHWSKTWLWEKGGEGRLQVWRLVEEQQKEEEKEKEQERKERIRQMRMSKEGKKQERKKFMQAFCVSADDRDETWALVAAVRGG